MNYFRNTLIGLIGMLLAACVPYPQAESDDGAGAASLKGESWQPSVQNKVRPVNVPYL